jgi:hypothetical protein
MHREETLGKRFCKKMVFVEVVFDSANSSAKRFSTAA